MRNIPLYISLLVLLTCAKEDNTPPPQITKQYTLSVTAGEGGSVSISGGAFAHGTEVSVTATPSAGYSFSGWSNGSTSNPLTVTLNSNISIEANFVVIVNSYTLSVSAGEGGSVSSEGGEYEEGTEVTVTATPDNGYEFTGWSNGSSETTITITLNQSINLTANFIILPIENNIFNQKYIYFEENYKVGDLIEIDGVSFIIDNFSVLNSEGWISWNQGQFGISEPMNYIAITPLDCYNSNLSAILVFNSNNGDFLMIRFDNLNFDGDSFHFLMKRFYNSGFNPPFNDNDQSKYFDSPDLLFYNAGNYINELKEFNFETYDVTFKKPEGGYFELKNLQTSEVNVITNDTLLYISDCDQNFIINAIPDEGFHFDGWIDPVLDTIQMIPALNLDINSSIQVESRFISKNLTGKSIIPAHNFLAQNLNITDDMLNFRGSENFIVWWDKDWFHNNDAKSILYWSEFTYSKAIEYGMQSYNEAARTNIYIHHVSDEYGNEDVFSDGWGQFAGQGENYSGRYSVVAHPYFTRNSIKKDEEYDLSNFEKIKINPLYPKINVHHEVFHVMQQYAKSSHGGNVFNLYAGWYTEATAEWFEVTYRPSPDIWRHAPYYLLNPYIRLWDHTTGNHIIDRHRYGASLLLFYLEWNNIVDESFFGQSYYSGTNLTPQEYLNNNIPDFKDHFIDFAGKATVIDFKNSVQDIKQQKQIYMSDWSGGIDTQFELVLNDQGTNGVYTPERKIEGWAYQTVKLNSVNESNYTYKFDSNLLGSEGGLADFNLIIIKEKNGEFTYEKKYIADDSIVFEFTAEANTIYYFTIVNTPEKFTGSDQYNYNVEIEKLIETTTETETETETTETETETETETTSTESTTTSYQLTINSSNGGSTSIGSGTYNSGQEVSVTANPEAGYRFTGWTGDLTSSNQSISITVDSNKTITANFELIPTYTLTVNAGTGGSVSSNGGTYTEGESVTITATPNTGYNFNNWSGDSSSDSSEITITMNSDTEVTANFEIITYTLTVNSGSGGSVSSNGGTYNYGQEVTITATAQTGYYFVNWSGDSLSDSSEITITIDSDTEVTANFEIITYTLTVNSGSGGSVSLTAGTYNYGQEVTITATAQTGYYFVNWSGDSLSDSSEITITIDSNKTITANFNARNTVSVQVINDNGAQINYSGNYGSSGSVLSNTNQSITLYENETITFTIVFPLGWYLNSWGGDLSGNESEQTVTLNSDFDIISTDYEEYSTYAVVVEVRAGGSVEWTSRVYNNTNTAGQTQTVNGFYPGEEVTLKAIPSSGFSFLEWECTAGCSGNTFGTNETLVLSTGSNAIRVIAKFQ